MKTKISINGSLMIKVLISLVFTNYFLVTILLNNQFPLPYIRDMLLIALFLYYSYNCILFNKKRILFIIILSVSLFFGAIRSYSLSIVIQEVRRYLFPLIFYFALINGVERLEKKQVLTYLLYFTTALSIWGVFQALVLKDTFLMNIGYPVRYAPEYGRMALNYSYYFGNLGIQRVASTFSSSNICGGVFGLTLLFFIINKDEVRNIDHSLICMIIILFGYIMTYSRSNFLAMIIVLLIFGWNYIPNKKRVASVLLLFMCITLIAVIAFKKELVFKVLIWVKESLQFKDSSSAGRFGIWYKAFSATIKNPFGIGIGYTGENAYRAGASIVYACENSYLSMSLDLGWIGMLSYLSLLLYHAKWFRHQSIVSRDSSSKRLSRSVYCIIVYIMIMFLFSNHIKDIELMILLYLYIAIGRSNIERGSINE